MNEHVTFAGQIEAVAAASGLTIARRSPEHLLLTYDIGGQRRQTVHVISAGDLGPHPVVALLSFAAELPVGLADAEAEALLEWNGQHKLGYWAIFQAEDTRYLAISHNLLLESLDALSFRTVTSTLALEADTREQAISGLDRF